MYEESADSELAHVQSTLYEIIEFFGYIGSKHDKERLRVNIEPGEDYSETIC